MPAKSVQQREFMGMVHAYQEGKIPASKASSRIKKAAKSMTREQSREFAATPEKGLPIRVRKTGRLHKVRTPKAW